MNEQWMTSIESLLMWLAPILFFIALLPVAVFVLFAKLHGKVDKRLTALEEAIQRLQPPKPPAAT